MLETLLGPMDFNTTSLAGSDVSSAPHIIQIRRQSLQVCNFVMGHLPGYPIRMEGVHRAQKIFALRALLLRSFQEAGEWEDLVEGIEVGVNILTPPSLPVGSVGQNKTTLDGLLLRIHCIGKSICDGTGSSTSSRDSILYKPP